MERRKVLNLKGKENEGILSLSLKGLNNLENIHLSMDYLIDAGLKAFLVGDISKAKEISILSERIDKDIYDKRSLNFKYRVLLKEALINFNEVGVSLSSKLKCFNKLKEIDNNIRLSFELDFDDELMNLLDESDLALNSFWEKSKDYINDEERSSLEKLEFLYLIKSTMEYKDIDEELKKLESRFRSDIKEAGKVSKNNFINIIKNIYGEKYEEKFYYSKELIEGYSKIINFENVEMLLKDFNNFNLLYKFNRSRDLDERKEYINLMEYEPLINLSSMERDIIVRKLMGNNEIIFNVEDLKIKVNQLISLLKENKEKNALII